MRETIKTGAALKRQTFSAVRKRSVKMRRIEAPRSVRSAYEKWCDFLENNVEFQLKTSDIHTKEHCGRVLLFALLIADKMKLSAYEKEILCHAAVFHDSRRLDDSRDIGHGRRAADYYREFCAENGLKFHRASYEIMSYHDRRDAEGEAAIKKYGGYSENTFLLYKIFKDADALDRFRLGKNGLNVRYLRTYAARVLCNYAKAVWHSYSVLRSLNKTKL